MLSSDAVVVGQSEKIMYSLMKECGQMCLVNLNAFTVEFTDFRQRRVKGQSKNIFSTSWSAASLEYNIIRNLEHVRRAKVDKTIFSCFKKKV